MPTRFARPRLLILSACFSLTLLSFSTSAVFGACGSLSSPSTSAIVNSGDFNTAGTWDNGVPNNATNTCIVNGTVGTPTTVTLVGNGSVSSLQVNSNNTLNVSSGSILFTSGPQIINGGAINLNAGAGNAILSLNASATLSGAGTLTLSETTGAAIIQQQVGGVTLTNASNIVGAGTIGNGGLALSNSGTVNANSSGQTLFINGSGGLTNSGLLTATGPGTLRLDSQNIANTGNITANGGTVTLNSTTVNGGTLNQTGGGTLQTITGGQATLNGVTLSSGSTYLNNNSVLLVSGTITNNGTFQLNSSGGSNSIMGLNNNTTLTGGGTLTLNEGAGGGAPIIQQQVGGLTLTNSNNLIQGAGTIGNGGLAVVNNSTISANQSGKTLFLNGSGGVTNNSLLTATGGGIMEMDSLTVANAGANITANGGTVTLNSSTINGGTLNQTGGGTLQTITGGQATLNGVTLSSGSTYLNNNAVLLVSGAITNNGTFQINSSGGSNSFFGLNNNTTLTGGGAITLNQGAGAGAPIIQQQVGGLTLTNTDNLIQGAGTIGNGGLTVINNATINANSSGQTLFLNGSGGVTNTNLIEATGGGTLQISTVINNAGGNITSGNGSSVLLNSTIQGGTLNTLGTGTMGTNVGSVAVLDGSTQGALTLSAGSTYTGNPGSVTEIQGTITNKGLIQINGTSSNTYLGLINNTTLNGGGTVTLASTDSTSFGIIQQQVGGLTLTNAAGNTINGAGVIGNGGLAVVNNGIIDASTSGQTLLVNGSGGVTNTNLLAASGGGTMQISTVVNNAGGNITSANGSAVLVNGTIQGGTLNTLGAGTMGTNAGSVAVLDGSTQGPLTISTGSTYTGNNGSITEVFGTITNKGTLQVSAGASNTVLDLVNNTTVNGGGTVTLSTAGGGTAIIQQAVGGLTLTNADNMIQGAGIIGNGGLAVNNQANGIINANVNGATLSVNGSGGLTNAGTLAASGGGTLLVTSPLAGAASGGFTSGTLTGNYLVDGSAGNISKLQINALGSAVGGGEVTQLGNGTLTSSITLNGPNATTLFTDATGVNNALALGSVTTNATLTIEGGYIMTTPDGFNNSGTVHVGDSASNLIIGIGGSGVYTQAAGLTVIDLGGTLTASSFNLNGGKAKVDGTLDPMAPVNIALGAELFGTGQVIGNVTNSGEIFPGNDPAPGTLNVTGNYEQTGGGLFMEDIAGTQASPTVGLLNVTGNVKLDSTACGANCPLLDIGSLSFTPFFDQLFTIVTFTGTESGLFTLTGAFASDFDVLYDPHDITLRWNQGGGPPTVPEPSFVLLNLALAGVLAVWKFRRKKGTSAGGAAI